MVPDNCPFLIKHIKFPHPYFKINKPEYFPGRRTGLKPTKCGDTLPSTPADVHISAHKDLCVKGTVADTAVVFNLQTWLSISTSIRAKTMMKITRGLSDDEDTSKTTRLSTSTWSEELSTETKGSVLSTFIPGSQLKVHILYHSDRSDHPVFIEPRSVVVFYMAGSLLERTGASNVDVAQSCARRCCFFTF